VCDQMRSSSQQLLAKRGQHRAGLRNFNLQI
jgi:hypothetical protein